jgi:branched-chain amino acid transport system substrate-binding protein
VVAQISAACSSSATPAPSTAASVAPSTGASAAPSAAASAAPSAAGADVAVCELAYYTGEFAPYGPALTADVVFPIKEIINLDPPLGRPWVDYHEDLGTVGEAQAARTCLEKHGAEILVSIAHGYRTYRDFMMQYWQENDSPLGPSVHGGLIPGNLGGKAAEPIFRAQGLDEGLGTFGSLYANSIGAKKVVIFATQVEGFQSAADAAEKAAKILGLEVVARINEQPEQPSYAAVAQKIAQLNPDAVIIQAGSVESATLIKQAAEAGISLNWIGETGWSQAEFINTLGTEPIKSQKGVGYTNFSPNTDTPAWTFYQPLRDAWVAKSGVDPTAYYGADNPYAYSTYDLLVQTALAVEMAGSYKASAWAPARF